MEEKVKYLNDTLDNIVPFDKGQMNKLSFEQIRYYCSIMFDYCILIGEKKEAIEELNAVNNQFNLNAITGVERIRFFKLILNKYFSNGKE